MLRLLYALAAALLASPGATAQIYEYRGPSPNIAGPALDLDAPGIQPGPVTPALYAGTGITSIEPFGTGWGVEGTRLYTGNYDNILGVMNGSMGVATAWDRLDIGPSQSGWEIILDAPVDELQIEFAQVDFFFHCVELFSGSTSLGEARFGFPSQASTRYFRAENGPFDRARITFFFSEAVGFNTIGLGNGPPPPPPMNDECAQAIPVGQGLHPFDTRSGTPSAEPLQCSSSTVGSSDVWLTYEAVTTSFDLEVCVGSVDFFPRCELYRGSCGALNLVACGTGGCGPFSFRDPGVVAGTRYWLRLAGLDDSRGSGEVRFTESDPTPPANDNCVQTYFAGESTTAPGGAVYFDIEAYGELSIDGIELNAASLGPIGLEVYMIPGSYTGNTGNPGGAGWTRAAVDNGQAVGQGMGQATPVNFTAPWLVPAGSWGVALVGNTPSSGAALAHAFAPGTPFNLEYSSGDGVLELSAGAASDAPWSGATVEPAVWNGRFCFSRTTLGTNYCTAAPNITGMPAAMFAYGSTSVAQNDLTLQADQLPTSVFGFFLTSRSQGFVMNPGGSTGNLCLSGVIGRYSQQAMSSGSTSRISLPLDLTRISTPSGPVAVAPGETWNFTLWYRDLHTSNFSDGLEILFE